MFYSDLNRSEAGRKGAVAFWKRFREDESFRLAMIARWKSQHHKHEDLVRAAKAGGHALWRKYQNDVEFRSNLDNRLAASRSRGGSHSLRNLGEYGFKKRLDEANKNLLLRNLVTNNGLRVRSPDELKVAQAFDKATIRYKYEPRFEVGDHAFYPDFKISKQNKTIEVAGYKGDRYWKALAKKIRLLRLHDQSLEVYVVTSYYEIVRRYLVGDSKVTVFKWKELEKMVNLCRDGRAGVHSDRRQSGLLRGSSKKERRP